LDGLLHNKNTGRIDKKKGRAEERRLDNKKGRVTPRLFGGEMRDAASVEQISGLAG
jgi:hypothetical protein